MSVVCYYLDMNTVLFHYFHIKFEVDNFKGNVTCLVFFWYVNRFCSTMSLFMNVEGIAFFYFSGDITIKMAILIVAS